MTDRPLDPSAEAVRPLWPDRVLHHGGRLALLVALAIFTTVLFPPDERFAASQFRANTVADEEVVARVSFTIPKSSQELDRERADARASVPPTFDYRPEAGDSVAARLTRFFDRLGGFLEADALDSAQGFLASNSIPVDSAQFALLQDDEIFAQVRMTAIDAAREILSRNFADPTQLQESAPSTDQITIRRAGSERNVRKEDILGPTDVLNEAGDMLPASAPPDAQQLLRLVLLPFLDYSLEWNLQATVVDRNQVAQAISPVAAQVLQNEVIVREGDQIDEAKLAELQAHERALREAGLMDAGEGGFSIAPIMGATMINLLILGVFGILVFFFRAEVYDNPRWITLIALTIAAYIAFASLVAQQQWDFTLLPVAFVALTVAILWDGRMALVLAMVLAILSARQPYFESLGADVAGITILGGAAAALSVRAVRRRSQAWLFGAIIAGAYAAGLFSVALLDGSVGVDLGWSVVWAAVNSVLSAILAMGFLPMFEIYTGITTDQTLLEWADPNRPLLKRLSLEAPGTYAHTINVANLADSAAVAVGANSLLCRVGLYYHDIGKVLKPHYFVENQPDSRNPHDRLKPDKSAAIVKEHVTEGYRLAKEESVPDIVADFIPEHHGTQRIGFFWERAKEEYGEEELDPVDFRYPGPKPRSKETAIAMLADSVESATRALQDPTPERIRQLIEGIVDGKVADGQLDDSPLTLREVRLVKEQFIKVLSGIYHHRIDYPQTKHLTDREDGGEDGEGEEGEPEAPAEASVSAEPGASGSGEGADGDFPAGARSDADTSS